MTSMKFRKASPGTSGRPWTTAEDAALLSLQPPHTHGVVTSWASVAAGMSRLGFPRPVRACKRRREFLDGRYVLPWTSQEDEIALREAARWKNRVRWAFVTDRLEDAGFCRKLAEVRERVDFLRNRAGDQGRVARHFGRRRGHGAVGSSSRAEGDLNDKRQPAKRVTHHVSPANAHRRRAGGEDRDRLVDVQEDVHRDRVGRAADQMSPIKASRRRAAEEQGEENGLAGHEHVRRPAKRAAEDASPDKALCRRRGEQQGAQNSDMRVADLHRPAVRIASNTSPDKAPRRCRNEKEGELSSEVKEENAYRRTNRIVKDVPPDMALRRRGGEQERELQGEKKEENLRRPAKRVANVLSPNKAHPRRRGEQEGEPHDKVNDEELWRPAKIVTNDASPAKAPRRRGGKEQLKDDGGVGMDLACRPAKRISGNIYRAKITRRQWCRKEEQDVGGVQEENACQPARRVGEEVSTANVPWSRDGGEQEEEDGDLREEKRHRASKRVASDLSRTDTPHRPGGEEDGEEEAIAGMAIPPPRHTFKTNPSILLARPTLNVVGIPAKDEDAWKDEGEDTGFHSAQLPRKRPHITAPSKQHPPKSVLDKSRGDVIRHTSEAHGVRNDDGKRTIRHAERISKNGPGIISSSKPNRPKPAEKKPPDVVLKLLREPGDAYDDGSKWNERVCEQLPKKRSRAMTPPKRHPQNPAEKKRQGNPAWQEPADAATYSYVLAPTNGKEALRENTNSVKMGPAIAKLAPGRSKTEASPWGNNASVRDANDSVDETGLHVEDVRYISSTDKKPNASMLTGEIPLEDRQDLLGINEFARAPRFEEEGSITGVQSTARRCTGAVRPAVQTARDVLDDVPDTAYGQCKRGQIRDNAMGAKTSGGPSQDEEVLEDNDGGDDRSGAFHSDAAQNGLDNVASKESSDRLLVSSMTHYVTAPVGSLPSCERAFYERCWTEREDNILLQCLRRRKSPSVSKWDNVALWMTQNGFPRDPGSCALRAEKLCSRTSVRDVPLPLPRRPSKASISPGSRSGYEFRSWTNDEEIVLLTCLARQMFEHGTWENIAVWMGEAGYPRSCMSCIRRTVWLRTNAEREGVTWIDLLKSYHKKSVGGAADMDKLPIGDGSKSVAPSNRAQYQDIDAPQYLVSGLKQTNRIQGTESELQKSGEDSFPAMGAPFALEDRDDVSDLVEWMRGMNSRGYYFAGSRRSYEYKRKPLRIRLRCVGYRRQVNCKAYVILNQSGNTGLWMVRCCGEHSHGRLREDMRSRSQIALVADLMSLSANPSEQRLLRNQVVPQTVPQLQLCSILPRPIVSRPTDQRRCPETHMRLPPQLSLPSPTKKQRYY